MLATHIYSFAKYIYRGDIGKASSKANKYIYIICIYTFFGTGLLGQPVKGANSTFLFVCLNRELDLCKKQCIILCLAFGLYGNYVYLFNGP